MSPACRRPPGRGRAAWARLGGWLLCAAGAAGPAFAHAAQPRPAAAPVVVTARRPADFVPLEDVAAGIVQELRYAGSHNFTGAPLPRYRRNRCWLTRRAARALAEVDAALAPHALGLKVYDCYRPHSAVQAMLAWSEQTAPLSALERWFLGPLSRADVVSQRYLARRSAHSRGSTVDVTLIARGAAPRSLAALPAPGEHCAHVSEEVPLGTAHDCFAPQAHTEAPGLAPSVRAARALLTGEMARAGFVNYAKEWWHFSLRHAPHAGRAFDCPVD